MSLNYNYSKVPEHLRVNRWVYNGKRQERMGAKLNLLIWLTLITRRHLQGGAKSKREVLKRVQYLRALGFIEPILPGLEMVKAEPEYWKGAVLDKSGEYWNYHLTDQDVIDHWGLWTNSHYADETFTKWRIPVDAEVVRIAKQRNQISPQ